MSLPDKPAASTSDHLANERTFLAWIRTSIAIMGFGFVVVKFALFIKQISLVIDKPGLVPAAKGYSSEIGILLVANWRGDGLILLFLVPYNRKTIALRGI